METKRALGDAKNWRANNREDLELSLRKKGAGLGAGAQREGCRRDAVHKCVNGNNEIRLFIVKKR